MQLIKINLNYYVLEDRFFRKYIIYTSNYQDLKLLGYYLVSGALEKLKNNSSVFDLGVYYQIKNPEIIFAHNSLKSAFFSLKIYDNSLYQNYV